MKNNRLSTQMPQVRWSARALSRLPMLLLASCSLLAQAAETPAPAPEPASFKADQRYTFKQLGAQYPLNLRGVDGSNTLNFSVRNDRVVTGARVDLRYAYSPALLAELSHINVLVNDEVAATIPVPRETAGGNLRQTVEIPPYLITAYNDLRLQLIGHYTLDCEDPLHSSLWANISNLSSLDLATAALPLPNDLANLPLPFFDRRDMRKLVLPFVFQAEPDAAVLEAAGACRRGSARWPVIAAPSFPPPSRNCPGAATRWCSPWAAPSPAWASRRSRAPPWRLSAIPTTRTASCCW